VIKETAVEDTHENHINTGTNVSQQLFSENDNDNENKDISSRIADKSSHTRGDTPDESSSHIADESSHKSTDSSSHIADESSHKSTDSSSHIADESSHTSTDSSSHIADESTHTSTDSSTLSVLLSVKSLIEQVRREVYRIIANNYFLSQNFYYYFFFKREIIERLFNDSSHIALPWRAKSKQRKVSPPLYSLWSPRSG
jgi:hypothetical protein